MRKLVKYVGVLVSLLFLSGSAWAFNYADHVSVAPNGKGDLLYYKYYLAADNGWETKISVTNTSLTASVVAKVVIRSYKNSTELLDFLIYLSPSDVWTAKLYWNGTATKIYSEDSSCKNQDGEWASAAAPLDYALKTIGVAGVMPFCADDATSIGYIYIEQSAWATGAGEYLTKVDFGKVGVSKADIASEYNYGVANGVAASAFKYYMVGASSWLNSLAGYQVFGNSTLGLYSSAIQAVALKDYKNMAYLTTGSTDRIGTHAYNNLAEVEAAIAKSNFSLPYLEKDDAATVHIIGFPTKYTTNAAMDCKVSTFTYGGPFFNATYGNHVGTDGKVTLAGVVVYDVNENYTTPEPFSPSPTAGLRDEVNIFAVSAVNSDAFDEGWVSYPMSFTFPAGGIPTNEGGQALNYSGIPAFTAVVFFNEADSYAIDGAWDDGTVTLAGTTFPGYQYGATDVTP